MGVWVLSGLSSNLHTVLLSLILETCVLFNLLSLCLLIGLDLRLALRLDFTKFVLRVTTAGQQYHGNLDKAGAVSL